jgi:hypothetical protein
LSYPHLAGGESTNPRGEANALESLHLYALALSKDREHRTPWQRACELLLAEADVQAFSRQIELALFYDGKIDLAAIV